MEAAVDYRKCRRFYHHSTILIENENNGSFSYGKINNMSGDGMYFETEFGFKPGSRIKFKLDRPPFKSCPNHYRGIVKWCKEIYDEDEPNYPFGVGVEFC